MTRRGEKAAAPIPLTKPDIRQEDIQRAVQVLQSGMLVQGEIVEQLENELSERIGARHAILVANGTASLHLALLANGVGVGDEVIVPAFSYVATANVVELVGATPVFVDIELDSFDIDVSGIERSITPKTKAIIPVHEFGYPADVSAIRDIASKYGISVIEDAACALGTEADGTSVGIIGHIGSFSFHPRKAITSGEGGLIVTDDADAARYFRAMRSHGMEKRTQSIDYVFAGFNYRMTDIQAALLLGQLQRLDGYIEERTRIARRYSNEILSDKVQLPSLPAKESKHSWQSYHVLFENTEMRTRFWNHAKAKGVQTGLGAQCIPGQTYYKNKYGFTGKEFANAYRAYECGSVLPIYSGMPEEFVDRTIETVNGFKG